MNTQLYYVWLFNRYVEDYEPVGVFNTKEEADIFLQQSAESAQYGNGAVLQLTWHDFVTRATRQRLGELVKILDKLELKI